jgi:hypothetical protein
MRLTKERQKELENAKDTSSEIQELLTEIEALQAGEKELLDIRDACCTKIQDLKEECDFLKVQLENECAHISPAGYDVLTSVNLRKERDKYHDDFMSTARRECALEKERDALKADRDSWKANFGLLREHQEDHVLRLKARIEKLRDALKRISKMWHDDCGCMVECKLACEALAADEEGK